MEYHDYYQVLEVDEKSSTEDIKYSYRKLARKYHPDLSKENNAEAKFNELGEAYEVLKDAEKRREYERFKKMGFLGKDGSFSPPPNWHPAVHTIGGRITAAHTAKFSEFFESIFGASEIAVPTGGPRSTRVRGEDVHYKLQLSLEEVFNGCEKQIQFNVNDLDEFGHLLHYKKTVKVKIPKGTQLGEQIRLVGQGAAVGLSHSNRGDLFIEIDFAPHPLFAVQGQDIYISVPITPWEAAIGATITAPGLASKVTINIPKGSSNGQKLRLKGKGLTGKTIGDQIIILQISIPKTHNEAAIALYKQLAMVEKDFNPRNKLGV